jgi:hypothetical protein
MLNFFYLIIDEWWIFKIGGFGVKTQSKEPQRESNVRLCHKKVNISFFFGHLKPW